jgi:hypothetical protein
VSAERQERLFAIDHRRRAAVAGELELYRLARKSIAKLFDPGKALHESLETPDELWS